MDTQAVVFPRLTFSLAEAEVLIGVSRPTLYRMMERGELKTVQVGRQRRIPQAEMHRLAGTNTEAVAKP